MGKRNSLTNIVKDEVPHLIIMHCINHRIELAALGAIKEHDVLHFAKSAQALSLFTLGCQGFKATCGGLRRKVVQTRKLNWYQVDASYDGTLTGIVHKLWGGGGPS